MSNEKSKPPAQADVTARLTREVGILAGRLARFLSSSRLMGDAVAEGQGFLQAFFEIVSEGRPLDAWSLNPLDRRPAGEPHPFDRLTETLSLSPIEAELLLLGGLCEEHEGFAAVLRSLHPRAEPRVSVGLAARILGEDRLDRHALRLLLETSAVVRSRTLRITGDGPLFERSLQLPEALWSALHGIEVWPASVNVVDEPIVTVGLDEWFATTTARRATLAIQRRETCTIVVTGDNDDTAFERARALVAHSGARCAGILLPAASEPGLESLIQVHSLARGAVPVVKLAPSIEPSQPTVSLFKDFPAVAVGSGRSSAACAAPGRRLVAVPVERLLPAARKLIWSDALPELASQAPFLAARYPVEPALAKAVAADLALVADLEERAPTVDDAAISIHARGNISFSPGVRLLRPVANWQDLVLPADRLEQLREAVARLEHQMRVFDDWGFLRNRGGARGVRLLFAGPPGTGKTLSAEVLANALKIDLLVVDLSRVVSKWIGETEKNLSGVFDAAERGQAALFFDEADALFGKRTEVVDAHDRYANLETAYLLTRLEQFEGLAILATNLRQNIDTAFLRRLEFVLDFEEPDREERLALWKCHLPNDAPLDDEVNLYELAALYPIVGAMIRNAAVAAGFLAAADGVPIDRHHFIHAIRREYAKAGRSFPGAPIGLAA
ncbi:MAG TPA: ATP-binding protein [Pyrinomonadaceae bacterium]|nr:ATP-binding protein [Pyrinomonadaceae bacterium]